MRFSAATTADRFLPERLASRTRPLLNAFDAVTLGEGERNHAARMSLITFVVRVVSAAIAFLSQVVLARWMGGFEYGVFVLVWTALLILGNLSCLGFHTSIIRFVPEYMSQGRFGALRGILFASRLVVLGASTLIAIIGWLIIHFLSDSIQPHHVVPFMLGMICLPMMAMSDLMQGVARGHAWPFHAMLPTFILRPLLLLILMVGAIAAGAPANAETAMLAAIVASYSTTLLQLVTVSNRSEREAPKAPRSFGMRGWMIVALPVFIIEGFIFILTNADVLMVGFFLPPTDVAVYFATVKTLALVHFVYFAIRAGVAQRFASLIHGPERAELAAFARDTVRWTFWPSVGMGVLLLLCGDLLLSLFGPEFTAGYPLLFVLVAGVIARATVGPAESLLTMGGYQNACARLYALVLVINVALSVALIPAYGLWGAAIASALSMASEAVLLAIMVRGKLGIDMWMGASLRPLRGAS